MTRPRLIIHIGTHKTGTTAIQEALRFARPALASHGVLVPRTDRPPWPELPKHCSVFSAAVSQDADRIAAERAALLAEFGAAGAEAMLITEEGLSEPNPALSAFFAPMTDRFDLHVVCFLRRPDRFIESLFNQFAREPVRRETRHILGFSRAPAVRQRLDYHGILQRWQALPAQVHAIAYDALAGPQALLDSFAAAIGLRGVLQGSSSTANTSPDMRVVLLMQRLTRAQVPFDAAALMRAARQLQIDGRFPPCRTVLGRAERERLLADVAPGLRLLAEDFGVRFDDRLPDAEPAGPTDEPDLAYVMELAAALSRRGA